MDKSLKRALIGALILQAIAVYLLLSFRLANWKRISYA